MTLPPSDFDRYVQPALAPSSRRWTDHIGSVLLFLPRLGIAALVVGAVGAVLAAVSAYHRQSDLRQVFVGGMVVASGLFFAVELALIAIREAMASPWPGIAPTTFFVLLRALFVGTVLIGCSGADELSGAEGIVAIATSLVVTGFHLPAAVRCLRSLRRGIRSLSTNGPSLAVPVLRGLAGDLGRRLVTGRSTQDGSRFAVEAGGFAARFDEPDAEVQQRSGFSEQVAVLAHVHVDGDGYRSMGARLGSAGLPVWIFPASVDDAELATLRRRLRTAAMLDEAHLVAAILVVLVALTYVHRHG